MRLVVDSSSFAKRYIEEDGSNQLDELFRQTSELALCVILIPEIISALNRRLREKEFTDREYRAAKKQLLDDVHDVTILQITPAVIAQSVKLLESNSLRAMDALHVACALEWNTDLFITSDRRQFVSAVQSGIQSRYLGNKREIKGEIKGSE